jgi:hypothetical protein
MHVHVAEREWSVKGKRALNEKRETGKPQVKKREKRRKRGVEKAQHRAFPRGPPPPQYYPGSNLLKCPTSHITSIQNQHQL